MSSSNMLKGFGIGADVVGQLATDKALRRKSTGTVRGFDITDGELVEDVSVINGDTPVPHSLSRVPTGALVMKQTGTADVVCTSVSAQGVVLSANAVSIVTVWVA